MTEDELVGWHHRLDGREFEQAPRVGDGQGVLVCCSPWGHKESDTTEQLNNNDRGHLIPNFHFTGEDPGVQKGMSCSWSYVYYSEATSIKTTTPQVSRALTCCLLHDATLRLHGRSMLSEKGHQWGFHVRLSYLHALLEKTLCFYQ